MTDSVSRAGVQLLSSHIEKEDNIHYPMANRVLSNADQGDLMEGFEEIETRMMGPGLHERYSRMIERWEKDLR